LLVFLAGLVLLLVAGVGGRFDASPVAQPATSAEALPGPRMRGVHVYEGLGDGVTLRLAAASIGPKPGRFGAFVSWLKPIVAVADARVTIDGPAGEQVIITGRECRLSDDGRTIVFDRGVRWRRIDLGQVYSCRRLRLNLDDQSVAFEDRVHLQGPDRTTWEPFQIDGFFSPFPPSTASRADAPAIAGSTTTQSTPPFRSAVFRGAHSESPPHEPH